jgi:methyl-accepting chemotaxis protein
MKMAVGTKIITGYVIIILFVAIAGGVGYLGIRNIAHNLRIVGDEEAPLVDMANEMKISLWRGRNSLEEFKGATAAIANTDPSSLAAIEDSYQLTIKDFDTFAEAILEGGTLQDGAVIIKTDNEELGRLVRESDKVHNDKFQVAANGMIAAGKELVYQAMIRDSAMEDMEEDYIHMCDLAVKLEEALAAEAGRIIASDQAGGARDVLENEIHHIDLYMEIKFTII